MRTRDLLAPLSTAVVAAIVGSLSLPLSATHFSDWANPENVGSAVNSVFNEQHAALSPDGLSLYFVSDRPGGLGGFDIYAAHRPDRDSEWGDPIAIEALNSAASEFAPAFDPGGHLLFFGSERPGGCGGRDLWVSVRTNKRDDLAWASPVNLGCVVNSPGFDDGPTYFEDEETGLGNLYFISNRAGGRGDRDIWKTTRSWDGSFSAPVNVTELNSVASDSRPGIRRDGLEIFFTSSRAGSVPLNGVPSSDLWTSVRSSTIELWSAPVNVGSLNSSAADAAPTLSKDGMTLYFNSDRAGGFGALDLYVARRVKSNADSKH
jgi:Tol biopolymer transport system component